MATHIYTSVVVNYLPKARVLAESIKKFHPDWIFHLVLCDRTPEWFSLAEEPFDSLLNFEDLGIPDLPSWTFKHDLVELSTAVKGFALCRILEEPGCTEVFYFDPDIVVLAPLGALLRDFEDASVLLTPHSTEPESNRAAVIDNELTALRHGTFNLGFIGVKNSQEGRRFASWWRDRLQEFCYNDVPSGLFTDQRWADMVPAYFSDAKILRDPVYNVSTWNLTHRTVTGSAPDRLLVKGQPLVFYHFSGFDSGSQWEMLKKYGSDMPALFELREWYIATCERRGQQQLSQVPWAYGFFDNGQPILSTHRKRYRETPELEARFPNPYATQEESQSYLQWFELHGKPPFYTPPDLPPCTVPPYRIFLIGAAGDAESITESVLRLGSASVERSQFFLVVSDCWELNFSLPERWQTLRFNATRYEDLFAAVVGQYSDRDMLVIRAGVAPPENWDLRLAWSAARHPSTLAVSPVDRRQLDPAGTLSHISDEELDRLCYWYRQSNDPETASVWADCVYLRAARIKEITDPQEPLRPSDLIREAAQMSYSCRLATHVCCSWLLPNRTEETARAGSEGSWQVRRLRDAIRGHAHPSLPAISKTMTGPTLCVMHGGEEGVEQWLEDSLRADKVHEVLVLKSFGRNGSCGKEVRLYRYSNSGEELLQSWQLTPEILTTAIFHKAYREILAEIYREFRFERVLVSSLIGHALECLRMKLPVIFTCPEESIDNCFPSNISTGEWRMIRTEFRRAIRESDVTFTPPIALTRENGAQLSPVRYDSQHYFHGPRAPDPVWERRLQLFWRTPGTDFSEDNSFTAAPLSSERQLLRLYFPEQNTWKLEELRLDLSAQSGFLVLHRVSLLNVQDETVWSWKGDPSFWESVRSAQVLPIGSGSLLYLTGDDSFLILPVPADLLKQIDAGGSVEVDLTLGTNMDYVHDLAMALQGSQTMRLQTQALTDMLRNDLCQVQSELSLRQEQLREREQRLRDRSAELAAAEAELAARNQDLAVLENDLRLSEDHLSVSQQNLRKSEAEAQELRQQAESFRLEAEHWREVSVALQKSLSWRATKPMRAAASLGRKMLGRSSSLRRDSSG